MANHSHDDLERPAPRQVKKSAVDAVLSGLIKGGSGFVSLLSGLLAAVLILYSGYVIYDSFNTQYKAYTSAWDLLKYKPEIIEDNQTPLSGANTLASINRDYRAWLSVYDTSIDYPVVQGENDLYYASHDVYGNPSLTGAIYLAAGNSADFSDSYNLVYGHHMDNGAMFGGLDSFRGQGYFNAHRQGVVVAGGEVYDVTFFAVAATDAYESRVYSVGDRMGDVLAFLASGGAGGVGVGTNVLIYDASVLEGAEKVIALSTCASAETSGRLVVFGVMKRREITTFVTVLKVWDDDDNRDALRPDSLTLELLADGERTGTTVSLTAENGWTATLERLPAQKDGVRIVYSWMETVPAGYTQSAYETEENVPAGDDLEVAEAAPGSVTTITNTHAPATVTRTVTKVWDDDNDRDGLRPATLTVTLNAGGAPVGTVTLSAANGWTGAIEGLPVNAGGAPIAYAWTEPAIPGYGQTGNATVGNATTITNAHAPETVDLTVQKVWNDQDNAAGRRPGSLTFFLMGNGQTVGQAVLSEENGWQATLTVPRSAGGAPIDYRWLEQAVAGYTFASETTEDGLTTVTNTPIQRPGDRTPHTLTIRYRAITGEPVAPDMADTLLEGDAYDVLSPTVAGYRCLRPRVTGAMPNRDVVYTVFYVPEGDSTVVIDDFEKPLGLGEVIINTGDCFE